MYREWIILPNGTRIFRHRNGIEYQAMTAKGDLIHVIGRKAVNHLIERQKHVSTRRNSTVGLEA